MVDGSEAVYKIALNSSLEFGPMYDPNKKRDEALVSCQLYSVPYRLVYSTDY